MLKTLSLKSEFTKNTFVLIIGTVVAQSIPILLQPFLRRIYSPEDFGAMAVYLTIFGMITIASSLRYEAAIVLPKNNIAAANILSLACLITISFSIILFAALFFFKNEIVQLINFPNKYSNYLYFLPFACSAFSIFQNMNYWLIRQKAFKASATNKIVRRGIEGAVQTASGILKIPGGLFFGDLAGNIANVFSGIRQLFKNDFALKFISLKKIKCVLKRYSDFPKFNVLPTLLSSAATVLPFLFINKLYSTETVGYLDLSRLVLSIPLIFISSSISHVFFQQTTEKKNSSLSIKKDIMNILYMLLAVIFVEALLILLFGPALFGFVFGRKYEVSGFFSQILVFSFALNFIGSAFSSIFITFEKIRLNSIWQILYFLAICSLLFFKGLGIYGFLKIYVLIEIGMLSVYCIIIYFIVSNYENKIKKHIHL
ncbi:MAG: lipopolysaccharide biosynthesis protein [Bacteroidetes bacterium]|nr:lipopolysaccharide biosynthesis protein [Bacteroidota bacterium]